MADRRRIFAAGAAAALLALGGTAEAQSWRTMTSSRQLHDRAPLAVAIDYGAGELKVVPAQGSLLYQMEMRYDEDHFSPVTEYDAAAHTLRLGITSRNRKRGMDIEKGSRAEIALSREVPIDLDLDFGAGHADLDLGGVSIRRLDVSTGASETRVRFGSPNPIQAERISIQSGAAALEVFGLANTRAERFEFQGGVGSTLLDFSGKWGRNATASVEMGIGAVTLRLPRGLGVRVNKDSFLTKFDSQGLVKRGSSFFSPDWDSATHQLTIDVDAAFGAVKVEWVG